MLVLTRMVNETIVIDGHIHITIVRIRGDQVRLGIAAPPEVTVDRLEVHRVKRAEGRTGKGA